MEIVGYILYGVIGLFCLYVIFRIISIAIFKSFIDAKLQTKERRNTDGNNGSD